MADLRENHAGAYCRTDYGRDKNDARPVDETWVLGGTSRVKRDVRMRELIAQYIPLAVRGRTQIYVRKPRFEQEVQPGDASIGNL